MYYLTLLFKLTNIVFDINLLFNSKKKIMHSSFFVATIFLLIQTISGQYVQDNRVIIGSSIGGVLGLVSYIF